MTLRLTLRPTLREGVQRLLRFKAINALLYLGIPETLDSRQLLRSRESYLF